MIDKGVIVRKDNSRMDVQWDTGSYHHHVSSERVCQVSDRGVAISIRGLALGAVSWLAAPASKNTS